ncbi:MAG: ester cyclase [Pseudomonadota bacterium]
MSNAFISVIEDFQRAALEFQWPALDAATHAAIDADAHIRVCHPFGDLIGPDAFLTTCLNPLRDSLPDVERRDLIVLAGTTPEGAQWIGTMGNYMGTFTAPLLGIPPTGHLVHMRYHEFFQIEQDRVVQMHVIWDLPELMMQANAWPMAPQLGAFLCTPAPMSGDGLTAHGSGIGAMEHVLAMLTDLCKYPANPDPAIMQLEKYWHPQFNWYGPAGIGTARGIAGFRHWHQMPFLRAMPDRKLDAMGDLMSHWVAQGNYVCETGWPNMRLTLSDDGWMGIAPVGKEVLLRSLDFWRLENGLIRENWVLVDLLDLYRQVGVDVLARLQEFNKARTGGAVSVPDPLVP